MNDDEEMTQGEMFAALREQDKRRKEYNRDHSTKRLTEAGIEFSSHNDGYHLFINHNKQAVDFWPSTGLYIWRADKSKRGRGVKNLIKELTK